MKNLSNKVAVITGAGGGLGRAFSRALALQGCHLALADINPQSLNEAIECLKEFSVKVSIHQIDMTNKQQVAMLPQQVINEHGKVNLLFNNTGITYQKNFATHSIEDWEKIIAINLWSLIYSSHYFLDALTESAKRPDEGAHIINLSSVTGIIGLPSQSSYCATKGAVNLLSEAMWAELQQVGIGVTVVRPGAVKTDMIKATMDNVDDIDFAEQNYRMAQKLGIEPDYVANKVIQAIKKNKLRIRLGKDSLIADVLKRIFPTAIHQIVKFALVKARLQSGNSP